MLIAAIASGIALAAIVIAGCLHVRNMYLEKLLQNAFALAHDILVDVNSEIVEVSEAVLLTVLEEPFGAVAERLVAAEDGVPFLDILDGPAPDITTKELTRALDRGAEFEIIGKASVNGFGPGGDLATHDKGPR